LSVIAHFAIGNFIRDGLKGGPILVNGDGTPYRSYLYAADLAIWLWTLLINAPSCRPYNVGSNQDMTIGAVAQTVLQETALGGEIVVAQIPNPRQAPARYVPSTERARIELGLTERINLPEAIRKSLQWTKEQEYP
jgi:nucleoside-diphosphate-sugar epimerase